MSAAVGGVEGCVVDEATVVPEAAEIDDVIGVESGLPGVMHVGGVELFVGTLEVAAHQLGGKVLFVGRDGRAWLRMAPGEARELVAIETPAGHQVWFLDDSATAGPC